MKLEGKLIVETRISKAAVCERDDSIQPYRDRLEQCLIGLCTQLEIPVPLWLKKNTKELGAFRRTSFDREQFLETVAFDRFEIKLA